MNNINYNKNLIDLRDDTIEITNIIKTNNNNNESIIEIHIQKSLVNSNKYCLTATISIYLYGVWVDKSFSDPCNKRLYAS